MAKPIKKFQRRPRDPNAIRAQANQTSGDFDSLTKEGIKIFKPKEGKNTVRILPPTWDAPDHFGYEVFINYGIGASNQKYFSLSKMKGEKDPLEEARKQAERSGNKKLADALKPTKRLIYWLIDRNAEEEGPQLWFAPYTFDKKLANHCVDEDTGSVIDPPIDDEEGGCDVRFYYEKSGKQFPDYPAEKIKIQKPSPLHEDEEKMDEWLEYVEEHNIPSVLNFYDYDHIASVFDGQIAADKGFGDDETAKSQRSSIHKQRTETVSEEDERPVGRATGRTKPTPQPADEEEVDGDTGEVIETKTNGNSKQNPLPDDQPATSASRIRERLAGRRARHAEDD